MAAALAERAACLMIEPGQVFGRLTVLEKSPERSTAKHSYWQVLCRCGTTRVVRGTSLTGGSTKSCGCLLRERLALVNSLGAAALRQMNFR